MGRKPPIKAPNPFGEVSLGSGMQPPATEDPASTPFRPVTGFKVFGQKRETHKSPNGFVLTERGWEKEETDG